jgi:thioredoxin 1
MTLEEFKNIQENNEFVVLKLGATWCGPCKVLEGTLEKVEGNYPNVNFVHCDVDESEEIAAEFRVRGVPTMIYFVDGVAVDKTVGSVSEATIREKIDAMISKKSESNGETK